MAELVFFSGTMDCGKSTLALQLDYTHRQRGRDGLVFAKFDRAGTAMISSRLGISREALEVTEDLDLWQLVVTEATAGRRIDYVVCDEAQFYSGAQVEQLARLVDEMGVDVYAFGITADFRTELFPGSKRLIELADRVQTLQVEALCWCGRRATHNARVVDGQMVVEGDQVVIGDTAPAAEDQSDDAQEATSVASSLVAPVTLPAPVVEYEVLCRRHYMRRMTSHAARLVSPSPNTLPFDLDICPVPTR